MPQESAGLQESMGQLIDAHDLVMFDLDGVVYVSGEAVAGAAEHVATVRRGGRHVAFVTNNASRTPEEVAVKLVKLGVDAEASDVVTSAQAAARLLAERFGPGSKIWRLGGAGLEGALLEAGLQPVTDPTDVVAVVSGYGPEVRWKDVMRAAVLVRDGLPYVATNADLSIPTSYGLAPGHGVLVRTISDFAGVKPVVAGKPERPLMDETIRRVGGSHPLMVGDRLDTDIEGANAVDIPSLLVLTGVTWLEELAAATPGLRPTYISPDMAGLFEAHPAPSVGRDSVVLGGWRASVTGEALVVDGTGSTADWWRVAATACWRHLDDTGSPADVSATRPPGPVRHSSGE